PGARLRAPPAAGPGDGRRAAVRQPAGAARRAGGRGLRLRPHRDHARAAGRAGPLTVAGERPGVAAFDFDGTLSARDTLVPFLRRARGTPRVLAAAVRAVPQVRDRDAFKLALI